MPGIILIAHAPLATAFKTVAQHAFPNCSYMVEALDVLPDMSVDEIEARALEILQRIRNPEALIFTDAFGATPCNVAQRIADGTKVKVIAGVNVPMLWRTLCYSAESLDDLVARALSGGTQGIMHVASSRPQNQTFSPGTDDQDQHHHQQ